MSAAPSRQDYPAGPLHPTDLLMLTYDACQEGPQARLEEARAQRQLGIYSQTVAMARLTGEVGVYLARTVVETIRGKGRNPGKKEEVLGLYFGRHDGQPLSATPPDLLEGLRDVLA